jgi:hypothetical protein
VRAAQKTSSNIFLKNKRKLCHVREVHTYKGSFGSFHSMKDMKTYVLQALKGSLSKKSFGPCLQARF